eukprot:2795860-Prymnesium_polylepis.1
MISVVSRFYCFHRVPKYELVGSLGTAKSSRNCWQLQLTANSGVHCAKLGLQVSASGNCAKLLRLRSNCAERLRGTAGNCAGTAQELRRFFCQ